jgi:hypothetical protein
MAQNTRRDVVPIKWGSSLVEQNVTPVGRDTRFVAQNKRGDQLDEFRNNYGNNGDDFDYGFRAIVSAGLKYVLDNDDITDSPLNEFRWVSLFLDAASDRALYIAMKRAYPMASNAMIAQALRTIEFMYKGMGRGERWIARQNAWKNKRG